MAVQVQFAHPWTHPDTGVNYTTGQIAEFDDATAKRLVFNGIARYLDGQAPLIDAGTVDDVELSTVLAGYEKKVPRAGANAGFVVTLGADGQTLELKASTGGSGGTSEPTVIPDATGTTKGVLRLTGDLGGTADAPTVPGLASKLDLEALQDAVNAMIVAGTGVGKFYDDAAGTLTLTSTASGTGGVTDPEIVRDTMAAALRAGTGITITADDIADTITIAATGGGTGGTTDPEVVRDTMAAALVAGANITITPNDDANTITITSTASGGGGITMDAADGGGPTSTYDTPLDTAEVIRDTIGAALIAGPGMIVTPDDTGNTITLSSTGSTDPEIVRDVMGAALVGGTNVTVTPNDAGDTITIAAATDPEVVRDAMATALQAGPNITITTDDTANTITISGSGGTSTVDAEGVRDTIGTALRASGSVTVTVDDVADTITIGSSATVNAADSVLLARANHTGTQTAATISDFAAAVKALVNAAGSAMNPHTSSTATRNPDFTVNFWSCWPSTPANAQPQDQLLIPADGSTGPSTVYLAQFAGGIESWTNDGSSATIGYVTDRFTSSPGALRLTAGATGAGVVRASTPRFAVAAGASYTITTRANTSQSSVDRELRAQYRLFDSGGAEIGSGTAAALGNITAGRGVAFNSLAWTVSLPASGGVTHMSVQLVVAQAESGETYTVDDLTVG